MEREYVERTVSTLFLLVLALLVEALLLILAEYKEGREGLVGASTATLILFDLHKLGKRLRPQANLVVEGTDSKTAIIANGYKNVVTGGEYVIDQTLGRITRKFL